MDGESLPLHTSAARPWTLPRRCWRWLRQRLTGRVGTPAQLALQRAIIDAAPDAIVTVDGSGRVIQANAAVARIFGHDPQAIRGQRLLALLLPGDRCPSQRAAIQRLLNGEATQPGGLHLELETHHADGEPLPVACYLTATATPGQRLYTAYFRDLGQQKRAERAMRRQREALYQSEKLTALGSLLAGVAHELNNPLSVVVGRSAMLGEQVGDPAIRDSLARIHGAAERCTRIVRTFLSMARQQTPRQRPTDINGLIDNTLELLSYGLDSSGVTVERELDPTLPVIPADGDQLGQVFLNLLVNAQQALQESLEPRSLRIHSFHDRLEGTVQIMVADSGPGIPDRLHTRIFDPYFTTKPVGVGTGVGLSICLSIVTAHGGTLQVDRAAEGGAQFLITLPVAGPATDPPPRIDGPSSA